MNTVKQSFEKAVKTTKVELSEHEQESLYQQLDIFMRWLEPLLEIDTSEIEPMLLGHNVANVTREDTAYKGVMAELQEAAPEFAEGYYLVPPVIE